MHFLSAPLILSRSIVSHRQDRYTALSVAQEGNHREIVALLSKYSDSAADAAANGQTASKRVPISIVTPINSPFAKGTSE